MQKLSDITICAFDTETSGAHPLNSEICEIAAVKWKNGKIVESFQSLIKPSHLMSDFIISIHGITNEMVQTAPHIKEKTSDFYEFIKDSYCVAHHAPFDMGFLSIEFERAQLPPIQRPVFCSSLISQKLIGDSSNHKLQTLVNYFGLETNTAHRALDDSESCLKVFLKIIEKFGWDQTVEDLLRIQGKRLYWQNFYLQDLKSKPEWNTLIEAIPSRRDARVVVLFKKKQKLETIRPEGIVRSPDGDYIYAYSYEENRVKRYYLDRILEAEII